MAQSFLRCDNPGLDGLLGPRMVGHQLIKRILAQQVGAAITQVHHIQLFAGQRRQHNRGAHALPLWVALGLKQDLLIGTHDGKFQPFGQRLLAAGRILQRGSDCLDRDPAGLRPT